MGKYFSTRQTCLCEAGLTHGLGLRGGKPVERIYCKLEHGILLLKPAGEKALLVALAEVKAQLGLITVEIEMRAKQVQEILEEV